MGRNRTIASAVATAGALVGAMLFAAVAPAAANPVGPETVVNSTIAGNQGFASIAADADGDYVVAWMTPDGAGYANVFARRFSSSGAPIAQRFDRAYPEVCDGEDNDLNGIVDDGVTTTYHADSDADTYGGSATATQACTAPYGSVTTGGDADDANSTVHPGAPELCDGKDNDQDGTVDEGFTDADTDGIADCVDPVVGHDADGDGLDDSRDPDTVGDIIVGLPKSSFASSELVSLRKKVDGCNGTTREKADKDDWITRFSDQHTVRDALDALLAALA